MGGNKPLVVLQRAENGFVLVGRRRRGRRHAGSQGPRSSRRDPTEVGGNRRNRALNMPIIKSFFCRNCFFFRSVFCVKDPDAQNLLREVTFVKCKDAWRTCGKRSDTTPNFSNLVHADEFYLSVSVQSHSEEPQALNAPSVQAVFCLFETQGKTVDGSSVPHRIHLLTHSLTHLETIQSMLQTKHSWFFDCGRKLECLENRKWAVT